MDALSLPEQLFLIASKPRFGRIATGVAAPMAYTLPAAVLAELALRQRIETDAAERVRVIDASPTGFAAFDSTLVTISSTTSPRSAVEWIRRMSGQPIRRQVLDRLIERGILRHEQRKILWIFPSHCHPANETTTRQGPSTVSERQGCTMTHRRHEITISLRC